MRSQELITLLQERYQCSTKKERGAKLKELWQPLIVNASKHKKAVIDIGHYKCLRNHLLRWRARPATKEVVQKGETPNSSETPTRIPINFFTTLFGLVTLFSA